MPVKFVCCSLGCEFNAAKKEFNATRKGQLRILCEYFVPISFCLQVGIFFLILFVSFFFFSGDGESTLKTGYLQNKKWNLKSDSKK